MNGRVIPNTPIAVDIWRPAKAPNARIFFLSHAHSDHMVGLSASWSETIYCSEITAKIVRHKKNVRKQFLHSLTLNEPHVINLDSGGLESMSVTLVDANHCPGAVMFLFEGYFGRVLYTGDFRYDDYMFDEDTILGRVRGVDDLYLDNTYCHPDCSFPSQKQAREDFLDLVCHNFDKYIVIPTNELGKEELFEELAMTTKTFIQVRPEKLAMLRLLDLKDVFTSDPNQQRIRLVPRKDLNVNLARKWNEERPTVVIVPTALTQGIGGRTPYENAPNIHIVPYSDHSSYSELMKFVARIRPKRLIPIVSYGRGIYGRDCKNRTDFSAFEAYLDDQPRLDFVIPDSVLEFMNRRCRRTRTKPIVVLEKLEDIQPRRRRSVRRGIVYQTPDKNPDTQSGENEQVEDATDNKMEDDNEDKMEDATDNKMEDDNEDKMEDDKEDKMEDDNEDKMGDDKEDKMGDDNEDKMGDDNEDKMEDDNEDNMETDNENVGKFIGNPNVDTKEAQRTGKGSHETKIKPRKVKVNEYDGDNGEKKVVVEVYMDSSQQSFTDGLDGQIPDTAQTVMTLEESTLSETVLVVPGNTGNSSHDVLLPSAGNKWTETAATMVKAVILTADENTNDIVRPKMTIAADRMEMKGFGDAPIATGNVRQSVQSSPQFDEGIVQRDGNCDKASELECNCSLLCRDGIVEIFDLIMGSRVHTSLLDKVISDENNATPTRALPPK